jgi:hypothetical protein
VTDKPSEAVEVEAAEAAEASHVGAVGAAAKKSHSKRKRDLEEATAESAKHSRNGKTAMLKPTRAPEVQTIGRGTTEERTAVAAYRAPVARMYWPKAMLA